MTSRTIVCGACGTDVPYGRLSCPSCGELLASVAGGTRRGPAAVAAPLSASSIGQRVTPEILHEALLPDAEVHAGPGAESAVPAASDDNGPEPEPLAPSLSTLAVDKGESAAAVVDDPAEAWDVDGFAQGDDAETPSEPEAGVQHEASEPESRSPEWSEPGGTEAEATAPVSAAPSGIEPSSTPREASEPEAVLSGAGLQPSLRPASWPSPSAALPAAPAWPPAPLPPAAPLGEIPAAAPPGAYVPPSMVASSAVPGVGAMVMPAGLPAPARAWAGHLQQADGEQPGGLRDARSQGTTDAQARVDRVAEFSGWLAIAGGALSAVGFLLPWGPSMIGATGSDYFDRWGLAGPFHLVVALAIVVITVAAIVPNPVPAWVRVGAAGTALGALTIGLTWPYVFGFSTTGPGALAVMVGAALLLAAGLTALATHRHAAGDPPV